MKVRLAVQNLAGFVTQLSRHPSALLGGMVILLYVLVAVFAPVVTPYDPSAGNLDFRLAPPAWMEGGSSTHWLGGDEQGRDLLTRILFGARISLVVGLLVVGISMGIGVSLGLIAGYFGGKFDNIISRFADLLLAFPFLIFALGIMTLTGPGFTNLIFALSFKSWVEFFRLVRGEILSEKTKEYVEAARALGMSSISILASQMLPNIIHSVMVLGTLRMGYLIIMEASLSFLGLGIPGHIPAWGSMIASGRNFMMNAWWISTFPGLALLILVLSINLFGEGLRDILDPRLKID
ncbi:peptide ABC transporter permease [Clostridiales bacterium PH28_bin88]|nr:peptide ABC transporter permease [Clostridiales bacterium PH28_bin88]